MENKKKIAFFSKGDDKFLEDVIINLSSRYETKKVTIRTQQEKSLIGRWMEWADICWFEWCDDLIAFASKLPIAGERGIICRLHSYEAFTSIPSAVYWNCVDRLVFVSEFIKNYVIEKHKIDKDITAVIPNGVNTEKWKYRQREPGFKAAYVGYINYKKCPVLLLQVFKALHDKDDRYGLYIAGQFQEPRYLLYFKQMVKELGIEKNFFFEGWQENLDQWLDDKNYILCTSVLESQNMSVMQAMAKGIKPVVHNFAGAQYIYDKKYLWNSIDEAVRMIAADNYDSNEYRDFVANNYSLEKQCLAIDGMVREIENKYEKGYKKTGANIPASAPANAPSDRPANIPASTPASAPTTTHADAPAGIPADTPAYSPGGAPGSVSSGMHPICHLHEKLNEFMPYGAGDFNNYDFDTANIALGKREKAAPGYELVEFVLNNRSNKKLVITGVLYDTTNSKIILPGQMQKSEKSKEIAGFAEKMLNSAANFRNSMAGLIFDQSMKKYVMANYSSYIWEKGIPASQFMPLSAYLKIAERYIFAAGFLNKNGNLLEAPCGFGYGAAYLSRFSSGVEAMDIAQDCIDFAKEAYGHPNIRWKTGNVLKLPYGANEFDTYISYEVLEHLPPEKAAGFFEEAYRVLKKSGMFIMSTPNRLTREKVKNPFHAKEYDYNELKELIGKMFNSAEYYSMRGCRIEQGMKDTAHNIIAVCRK